MKPKVVINGVPLRAHAVVSLRRALANQCRHYREQADDLGRLLNMLRGDVTDEPEHMPDTFWDANGEIAESQTAEAKLEPA
jgi:hypothetical protein